MFKSRPEFDPHFGQLPPRVTCDCRPFQSNEWCIAYAEYVISLPTRNVHSCRKCLGDAVAALSLHHAVMVERLRED